MNPENLAAATILVHGTEELKARFVDRLQRGELVWCLLYSKPGAGSDLAAVQTRAERDGDEWVVNGQKVWHQLRPPGRIRPADRPHRLGRPSPVASVGKLAMSRILHSAARLNAALLGARSLLTGDADPEADRGSFRPPFALRALCGTGARTERRRSPVVRTGPTPVVAVVVFGFRLWLQKS